MGNSMSQLYVCRPSFHISTNLIIIILNYLYVYVYKPFQDDSHDKSYSNNGDIVLP